MADEWEDEEDEDINELPYYRYSQTQKHEPRQGCVAFLGRGCLHYIVIHFAIALVLGTVAFGGSVVVSGLIRLGWRGFLSIFLGGLMILAYLLTVGFIILLVNHFVVKIMRDENF